MAPVTRTVRAPVFGKDSVVSDMLTPFVGGDSESCHFGIRSGKASGRPWILKA
ncbi:MAG: hypothetical protein NVS1B16_09980 [Pseudarthrobacter sp.]